MSGFVSRWARRKAQSALAASAPAAAEHLPASDARDAATETAKAEADLPPLDTLTADSDFAVFLAAGVSEKLQTRALAIAWRGDAAIASFRGMAEYDWDFNAEGYGRLAATDNVTQLLSRVMGGIDDAIKSAALAPDAVPAPQVAMSVRASGNGGQPHVAPPANDEPVVADIALPQDVEPTPAASPAVVAPPRAPGAAARRHGRALPT